MCILTVVISKSRLDWRRWEAKAEAAEVYVENNREMTLFMNEHVDGVNNGDHQIILGSSIQYKWRKLEVSRACPQGVKEIDIGFQLPGGFFLYWKAKYLVILHKNRKAMKKHAAKHNSDHLNVGPRY